jgi:hypothetical protein
MRWFRIQEAAIEAESRQMFEERGQDTIRSYVPIQGWTMRRPSGGSATELEIRGPMLEWLKEQYDRAERRETWLITMEAAITILVAA